MSDNNNLSGGSSTTTQSYDFKASSRSGYTSGSPKGSSGNIFVQNIGLNPLVNFNFMLRVEGIMDVPCKSVSAFTKENEYEYIKEGGLNDYVHMKRKQISKPFTFSVERYVGIDYVDPLPLGGELILPVLLFVSRFGNKFDLVERAYTFTGCTVISKEYGNLDAEKSGLLTERVTIAYRELLVVDTPGDLEEAIDKMKPFSETRLEPQNAIYNVNEVRKKDMKNVYDYYEKFDFEDEVPVRSMQEHMSIHDLTREQMEKKAQKANKYKFKEGISFRADKTPENPTIPAGGVEGNAIINPGEYRRSEMEEEAVTYEFNTPPSKRTQQKNRDMSDASRTKMEGKAIEFEFKKPFTVERTMQKEHDMTSVSKTDMEKNAVIWDGTSQRAMNEFHKEIYEKEETEETGEEGEESSTEKYPITWDGTSKRGMNEILISQDGRKPKVSKYETVKQREKKAITWDGTSQRAMNKLHKGIYEREETEETGEEGEESSTEKYPITWDGTSKRAMNELHKEIYTKKETEETGEEGEESSTEKYPITWDGTSKRGINEILMNKDGRKPKVAQYETKTKREEKAVKFVFEKAPTVKRTMQKQRSMSEEPKTTMADKAIKWEGKSKRGMNEELMSMDGRAPKVKQYETEEQMKAKAVKFEFKKSATGNRTMQKQRNMKDSAKKDMEGKAVEYEFNKPDSSKRTMQEERGIKEIRKSDMEKKASYVAKYEIKEKKDKENATPVRSRIAPHEDERPTPRIWQPVKKK